MSPSDANANLLGTTAERFEIGKDGLIIHNRGTGAPTVPVPPGNGDLRFDEATGMYYFFDDSRSKWLSVESVTFQFGRNGNTPNLVFYRGINARLLSDTLGWPAFYDGTIVGLAYSRTDVDAANFQIRSGGATIATVATAATTGFDNALDADVSQGAIMSVRNQGNTTNGVQAWIKVRWRLS